MTNSIGHETSSAPQATVRVWGLLIRVFHWGLVLAFSIAWLTADELQQVHEIAGYTVAGLIAFRLTWGVLGGKYARFAQFVRRPAVVIAYLRDMLRGQERRYIGHNPAGAAMVVALLFTLSGTAFTGWLMEEPDRVALLQTLPQIVAPAHADEPGDTEHRDGQSGLLKDVHETLANLMLFLAAVHVGGVVLALRRHHENLPRSMVTGRKRAPEPGDIV